MRTKQEIKEQIKKAEKLQLAALCKHQYAIYDGLEAEIRALKWVLTENKIVNHDKRVGS